MADVDALAQRAVGAFTDLARRGMRVAFGLALVTGFVALCAYALGLAALDGSTRRVWLVIGGAMVVIAIGAPLLVASRLWRIRASTTGLLTDVRTMLTTNADAERVVIETVEVEEGAGAMSPAVVGRTAQFSRMQRIALSTANLRTLPMAMRSVATFPFLLLIAVVLTLVFAVLGFLFLIAWLF